MVTKIPKSIMSTSSNQGQKKKNNNAAIRFKCPFNNTILDVLLSRGWQDGNSETEWDIYWGDLPGMKDFLSHHHIEEQMRISHFRNHYELTRKNLMVKNLKRLKRRFSKNGKKDDATKRCDFYPLTYELPNEYHIFVHEYKRNPGCTWIMKPASKSQGKGIFLFRKLKEINDWKKVEYVNNADAPPGPETYVVQLYIDNPYLIGGRKFDLRVYVLVTSFSPLKIWLYREGFARFSNTRFSLDSLNNHFVHLTNVAVQRTAPDYDPERGCKWSLMKLREYLIAKHGLRAVEQLMLRMTDIFILSLQSVQNVIIQDKHCFELYGYDILLDSYLKPWLIEVNSSPSLSASNKEDYNLKFNMLDDVLNVLDMEGRLSGLESRIGGFDLMWNGGPVFADFGYIDTCRCLPNIFIPYSTIPRNLNAFLGCKNDRDKQLKQLFKVQ